MAENYVSKFEMLVDGTSTNVVIKDSGARSLVAQEIADRSALIKTDGSGNTIITTGEKIVESSHDKETTIIDTNSTHVDGANTVNIGGAHTEVYGSTYGKTVTGKSTVHYNGGSEEIHKLPAKITAPDLTLDIANGVTYKKPTKYNDYFRSVVAKDTDGNAYNILVASDSTADLGSAAPYHSFKEFGIDNTGVTDCSTALASITDNVALSAGTYLIEKNTTITCQIILAEGAILNIAEGVTVTFKTNSLNAGRYQIFTGNGNVTGNIDYAVPEWFEHATEYSSAINTCLRSFNSCTLADKTYNISNSVVLNKSGMRLTGTALGQTVSSSRSIIKCSGNFTALSIGDSSKTEINSFPSGIYVSSIIVEAENPSEGIKGIVCDTLLHSVLQDIECRNFAIDYYFHGCIFCLIKYCIAIQYFDTMVKHGFECGGTVTNGVIGSNASIYFINCSATGTSTTAYYDWAFYITGAPADTFVYGFESSGYMNGIYITDDYKTSAYSESDITLQNVIIDSYNLHGIMLEGLDNSNNPGTVTIVNSYTSSGSVNAETYGIRVRNCSTPVSIIGTRIVGSSGGNSAIGIYADSSNGISSTGNLITDMPRPYLINGSMIRLCDNVNGRKISANPVINFTGTKLFAGLTVTGAANIYPVVLNAVNDSSCEVNISSTNPGSVAHVIKLNDTFYDTPGNVGTNMIISGK